MSLILMFVDDQGRQAQLANKIPKTELCSFDIKTMWHNLIYCYFPFEEF